MDTFVDYFEFPAVALTIIFALLGIIGGLVTYIIRRLTRGYDMVTTELQELKTSNAILNDRVRASKELEVKLIDRVDEEFRTLSQQQTDLRLAHGTLREQYSALRQQHVAMEERYQFIEDRFRYIEGRYLETERGITNLREDLRELRDSIDVDG